MVEMAYSVLSEVVELRAPAPDQGGSASRSLTLVRAEPASSSLEHESVLALASADDLSSAMAMVVESSRRETGAEGVEWWATANGDTLELAASVGVVGGRLRKLPLPGAGVFVFHGGSVDPAIESTLSSLAPLIRRRAAEAGVGRVAIELARRNEALEDFAALVAHELKNPLQAALVAADPSGHIEDALDLVETLLEAAQTECGARGLTSAVYPLEQAGNDLASELRITSDLETMLPLPAGALRLILRNLLSNAVAAGAGHVHVAAVRSPAAWWLLVDDDGVGLGDGDGYVSGSGLGLALCRRVADRFGGLLRLVPGQSGGTRAILEFEAVPG
jgi:signal transduction histidine kinase